MSTDKGYRKFLFWQKADVLVFEIYRATRSFPKEELYGITNQLRRAAVSVPTNIAEGAGRQNRNEFRQFINIALGSISEVEYLLSLARKLGFLESQTFVSLDEMCREVGRMLFVFYRSLKSA